MVTKKMHNVLPTKISKQKLKDFTGFSGSIEQLRSPRFSSIILFLIILFNPINLNWSFSHEADISIFSTGSVRVRSKFMFAIKAENAEFYVSRMLLKTFDVESIFN